MTVFGTAQKQKLRLLTILTLHKQYRHYHRLSGEDHLCLHSRKRLVLRSNYENQHSFYHHWFVTEASLIEKAQIALYDNDKAVNPHDSLDSSFKCNTQRP